MKKKDNMLLRAKQKLSSVHMYSVVVVILFSTLAFGLYQYRQKLTFKYYLQNSFQTNFYELVSYSDEVSNLLDKVRLAKLPNQNTLLFVQIWKQSLFASENLSELPYSNNIISNGIKFFAQAGDFAYALASKSAMDIPITDKEWKEVDKIRDQSAKLSDEFNKIKQSINDGNKIDWSKIERQGAKALQNAKEGSTLYAIEEVSKEAENIPTFIYDGPFSEHIENMEPRMTKGKKAITTEQGIEIINKFLQGREIEGINFTQETNEKEVKNVIPTYSYDVLLKGEKSPTISINITKYGGLVLWMLEQSKENNINSTIDVDKARKLASEFLEKNEYPDMKSNYYEAANGFATFNFTPVINNVLMYPDLIKLKVRLSDGLIVGFESLGYIMMHEDRDVPSDIISEEEARAVLPKGFSVERVNLAYIPLESKREVLCYEFLGSYEKKLFLMYINTKDTKLEKILQILKNENGVFTQ